MMLNKHKNPPVVGYDTGNKVEKFALSPVDWEIAGVGPSTGKNCQARENLKNKKKPPLFRDGPKNHVN